ncbi:MAG: FMN-binding negative transcriptional regulator [Beijerinckiaceae bacterium]
MYSRDEAKEHRSDVLHATIRTLRFGTLVVVDDDGAPQAAHIPFVLKTSGEHAVLEAHLARPNPIWKLLAQPRQALALFQGPQAYVRPGWYPAKQEHGKVVPTWSYVSVHVRGLAQVMMDMEALLQHIRELSDQEEAGQSQPWSVDDAPGDFIPKLARGIVGFTMPVTSIEGVWKVNQHRSEADRLGMIDGMEARGDSDSAEIAAIMRKIETERST